MKRDHTRQRKAQGGEPRPGIVGRMREALACLTGMGLVLAAMTYEYCVALRVPKPTAPRTRRATSGGKCAESDPTYGSDEGGLGP